jgi:hypothetical protein
MRRTTKITVGIILSIFALSLTFIIGFSFTDRKNNRHLVSIANIPQEDRTGINTEPYRTVVLEREYSEHRVSAGENCGLFLNPVTTDDEGNRLFVPAALHDFISVETRGDTLAVRLKVDALFEKYREDGKHHILFSGINLYLHTSHVDVINKTRDIPTNIRNVMTDTVKVRSDGDIRIDSCDVRIIEPLKAQFFKINGCRIGTLNIDLDLVQNWKVEKSKVGTENFTGSRRHDIILTDNEAKNINWLPKNKDSKLVITLPGDTTGFVLQ